ncbi:nuclear transport factor 2 family protein, partial [Escherichia coli]|nr:nuclear transport factor 2 family protein [Escherichia coli]
MSPERAVQEVMARYVRAVDSRDSDALVALYTPDGQERLSYNRNGIHEPIAAFRGEEELRVALATFLPPHQPGEWAHHATFDHLVSVQEDRANLQAQFVVYVVTESATSPEAQLTGYYDWELVQIDGTW